MFPGFVHSLMGGASGPKSVAGFRERRVPFGLKDLQDGLLDQAVQYRGYAENPCATSRFSQLMPLDRGWPIGSIQQFLADLLPVRGEVGCQLLHGHSVDARAPSFALDATVGLPDV